MKEVYILDSDTGHITQGVMEEGVAYRTVPQRHLDPSWEGTTVWVRSFMRTDVNSLGKDNDSVRRLLKETGYKADAANVNRIGREVRRTEGENAKVEARYKEMGGPKLVDSRGRDALKVAKRQAERGVKPKPKP